MKILFWSIGKPHEPSLREMTDDFTNRIGNYFPVQWRIISPLKNVASLSPDQLKIKEADLVLPLLDKQDFLVLLDERGKELTSPGVAELLQQRANEGRKQLVFLIGGAFGVDEQVMARADFKWSLSQLTFPHQLVRLVLAEQTYRACSILRNEKYHHS